MAAESKPRLVLIVDDDELFVRSLERQFQRRGVAAVGAVSAPEALELARRKPPDLALVDLNLGLDSGLRLIEDLRELVPEVAALVVSAQPSAAATVNALRYRAVALLPKPLEVESVLEIFRLIVADGVRGDTSPSPVPHHSLAFAERHYISAVLEACDGNVSATARWLKIPRKSLQRKLRKNPPLD